MKFYNSFNEMFSSSTKQNMPVFNDRKKTGDDYVVYDNDGNLIFTVFGDCIPGDGFGRSDFFSIVRVETGDTSDPMKRGGWNDQRTCDAIDLAYDAIKRIFGNVDIALHIDTLSINFPLADDMRPFVSNLAGVLDGMYNGDM